MVNFSYANDGESESDLDAGSVELTAQTRDQGDFDVDIDRSKSSSSDDEEFIFNKKFENPNYCGLNERTESECADYRKRKQAWNRKQESARAGRSAEIARYINRAAA